MKNHPDYHDGFFGMLFGVPMPQGRTPEYHAGWEAARRSKEIFERAGFSQNGAEFSAQYPLEGKTPCNPTK